MINFIIGNKKIENQYFIREISQGHWQYFFAYFHFFTIFPFLSHSPNLFSSLHYIFACVPKIPVPYGLWPGTTFRIYCFSYCWPNVNSVTGLWQVFLRLFLRKWNFTKKAINKNVLPEKYWFEKKPEEYKFGFKEKYDV